MNRKEAAFAGIAAAAIVTFTLGVADVLGRGPALMAGSALVSVWAWLALS